MPIEPTKTVRIFPKKPFSVEIRGIAGTNTTALNQIRAEHPNEKVENDFGGGVGIGFGVDVVEIGKPKSRVSFVAGIGLRAGYERQGGKVKTGEHIERYIHEHFRTEYYDEYHHEHDAHAQSFDDPYYNPYDDPYYYDHHSNIPYHGHDYDTSGVDHGHYEEHHEYYDTHSYQEHDFDHLHEDVVEDFKKYRKNSFRIMPEITAGVKVRLDDRGDYVLDTRALVNANVLNPGEVNVGGKVGLTINNSITPFVGYEAQVSGGKAHRFSGGVAFKF